MSTLDPKGVVWVGLYASNLALLIDFYENKVGFRVLERDHDYCIFDAGAGSLFEIWGDGFGLANHKTPREQSVIVGFLVEQLEPAVSILKARGVEPDTEIKSYLGTRWIYYTDPEGNRFELKDLHG
jgi:predicted enzyme related to lactoylglutathione lyase